MHETNRTKEIRFKPVIVSIERKQIWHEKLEHWCVIKGLLQLIDIMTLTWDGVALETMFKANEELRLISVL